MQARKIFFSILGTGFYEECVYEDKAAGVECRTRFIQQAVLESLGAADWDASRDRIVILLTEKARQCNWDKSIDARRRRADCDAEPYEGLEKVLEEEGFSSMLQVVDIPDGSKDGDVWRIFDAVYGLIDAGDEIYLDITHSFRYLPMLLLVLVNYSKFLKGTSIRSLTYGNYEGRDASGTAPVVDLMSVPQLLDWTLAASEFLRSGRSEDLLAMTKTVKGAKEQGVYLMVREMADYAEKLRLSNLRDVQDGIDVSRYEFGDWHKPLLPILEAIKDAYSHFKPVALPGDFEGRFYNSLKAARWCLEKKLYQQFLTVLQEGIQSFSLGLMCKGEGRMIDVRHNVSTYLSLKYDSSSTARNIVSDLERKCPYLTGLKDILGDEAKPYCNKFRALSNWRNCINHAWMNNEDVNVKKFKNVLEYYESFLSERKWNGTMPVCGQRIFLNLSNHPSSLWGQAQLQAAAAYGRIEDMPFPSISPEMTTEKVRELAEEYLAKIMKYSDGAEVTVHIMGELTFCFILVRKLQEHGIVCVASCAERIVREENGEKISRFDFVSFRNY